jgi:porin
LDTAKLLNFDGGTFFFNFQNQIGSKMSRDGAVQETSDATAVGRTQISECWYEQYLVNKTLRFKIGKIDANSDFSHIATSEEFLNSSMAYSPTIFGLPTHPDPACGALLFVYPTNNLYAGGGLFDGSTISGRLTGLHGLTSIFHASNLFLIGETGAKWTNSNRYDGNVGIGVWHITGKVPTFNGSENSLATGPYLFFEQTLWRPCPEDKDDDRGIAMFLQYGHADPSYSLIENHAGAGIAWTGPISSRNLDTFGLGVSWAELGHDPRFSHRQETVTEMFYRFQVTKFFSIKPDIQYIRDPGESNQENCLLGTLQIVIDF